MQMEMLHKSLQPVQLKRRDQEKRIPSFIPKEKKQLKNDDQ